MNFMSKGVESDLWKKHLYNKKKIMIKILFNTNTIYIKYI